MIRGDDDRMPTTDPSATSAQPSQVPVILRRVVGVDVAWILVAIGLSAIVGLVAVIVADHPKGPDRAGSLAASAPPAQFQDPPPPVPVRSAEPTPTASPTGTPAGRDAAGSRTDRMRRPPSTAPRTSPTPKPPVALIAGRRISLEPSSLPGYRLRHRDFRVRLDRLSSASRPLDRADATFTVRAGLASARCVSLESVNYPGFFLRHQNFALFLQRNDGRKLFAADATFCPGAGRGATVLRSINYPDRYLVERRSLLFLERVPAAAAVSFVVQPPL
jgi:non-reducing end alpha-L-arabinofuranosidase